MTGDRHVCGVCGWDIDPELEEFHAITSRDTGETYDYICDNHDPMEILEGMNIVDGRLA